MATWQELIEHRRPVTQTYDYPLGGDSPELRALLAGVLQVQSNGLANVTEEKALGIPAFSRGVSLIAGTIAGLPLHTYERRGDTRERIVGAIFDDPAGALEMSRFAWVETVVMHLVCYQEAFLAHVRNAGGALVGYWPVHPGAVTKVEWGPDGIHKRFTVHQGSTSRTYGTPDVPGPDGVITHILGPSMSGLRGVPVWQSHRALFQIALAAESAAGRTFTGALIRGLVTTGPDEDVDEDDATVLQDKLNARIGGVDHAGEMVFVNRHLSFVPWQSSNADAQYHESRAFQIEEFARLLGMPPHLLAQTEKATSWGTGISEQNLGLARYTLMSYTSRIEAALRPLNPPGEYQEFDYKGLLQGSPAEEITLLLSQVAGGILTADEARAKLNMAPIARKHAAKAFIAPRVAIGETNGRA